jgi:hypothetical protein
MNAYQENDAWWNYHCKINYDRKGTAVLGEIWLASTGAYEEPDYFLYNDNGEYVMTYKEF